MRRAGTVLVAGLLLAACGGGEDGTGGVIEENVVRPGITAIEQASVLTCDADIQAVEAALQSYEMLEGAAAPDEAALVEAGYLREPSELIDVVGGQIEAQNPDCAPAVPATVPTGSAPMTAPATDVGQIVTSIDPSLATADGVLATMSDAEIESYGGVECATELAVIIAAGETFFAREARQPASLEELTADLEQPITLWTFDAERQTLVPADGSPCTDVAAATEPAPAGG